MTGRFHKMHGLGNDFVVIDAREAPIAMSNHRARAIADRRTGIGCDQVILLEPSDAADATMRIWNNDGSEVEACGNAMRAVALLIGDAKLAMSGGAVDIRRHGTDATVTLGHPVFDWQAIPLAYAMDTSAMPVAWDGLEQPMAMTVGNPHLVFFVDDVDAVDLGAIGPVIEHDPLFPQRINAHIATVTGPSSIHVRCWERGAGLTLACGTGACASAVAAIRSGRVTGPVEVTMPGGRLTIDWQPGAPITMTGPATHVYAGETDWNRFDA